MKCLFRSFDVGTGDCHIVRLVKEDGKQFSIMVDCGNYTKSVKKYISEVLHDHIDLLIATHIDSDHIKGISNMLKNHLNLKIGQIWYNAYKRNNPIEEIKLNNQQKAIINQIKKELNLEFDAIGYKEVSAENGMTLAEAILNNEDFCKVWKKEPITTDTKNVLLPDGFGEIIILSPEPQALNIIDDKFKEAFDTFFMQQWDESLEKGECLQELLIRLVETYSNKKEPKPISSLQCQNINLINDIRMLAKEEGNDKSKTNLSSIAFILKCGEHQIAMLGDAHDSVIISSLESKFKKEKPIYFDAIKIAHHGSINNNSRLLWSIINSHKIFVSGSRNDEYPSLGTIGKIAETIKNDKPKLIVFNRESINSKKIDNLRDDIKESLGIRTVISEEEYELFE